MKLSGTVATCSGGPSATTVPPPEPPSRPEVDDPVGGLDDVEVVLDDEHRVALVDQAGQDREQAAHVLEVEAGRRLVEQVDGVAGRALGQLARASFTRCASPPDSVGAGWPRRT